MNPSAKRNNLRSSRYGVINRATGAPFTEREWDLFCVKATQIISSWGKGLKSDVKIDLDHTTPGIFGSENPKNMLPDAVVSKMIFDNKNGFRIAVKGAEPLHFPRTDFSSFRQPFTFYYEEKERNEAIEPLLVALFALCSEVTNYRLMFFLQADPNMVLLQQGLTLFANTTGIEFDLQQPYPRKLSDRSFFCRVFREALDNCKFNKQVIALYNEIAESKYRVFSVEELEKQYREHPLKLAERLHHIEEFGDYFQWSKSYDGLATFSAVEIMARVKGDLIKWLKEEPERLMDSEGARKFCEEYLEKIEPFLSRWW